MQKSGLFSVSPRSVISMVILLVILVLALAGPFFAPYEYDAPVSASGMPPSADFLLGTDALGRDVLSRVLAGGLTVIGLGVTATILVYIPAVLIGLAAGFRDTRLGYVFIGLVDVLLALPSIVLMLVIVAGLGASVTSILVSVVLVQLPSIARMVRVATREVSFAGYIDVALGRGEGIVSVLLREVLPNVSHVILADVGVRFGWSITLIASLNYLGLGLPPPTADWGLMIAENRQYISANVWSVVVPAILIGLLTVSVSILLDAYTQSKGRLSR